MEQFFVSSTMSYPWLLPIKYQSSKQPKIPADLPKYPKEDIILFATCNYFSVQRWEFQNP